MEKIINTRAGRLYVSELISSVQNEVHGFGVRGIEPKEYLRALNLEAKHSVVTDQMHSDDIVVLSSKSTEPLYEADAFITSEKNVLCFVRSADCVPILICDKSATCIAAVHAGWRGTVKDIVGKTVTKMIFSFGTRPEELYACIGPRICAECFEVGTEVVRAFEGLKINNWKLNESHVDLGLANRELLLRAGIPADQIEIIGECSRCNAEFASFRRDKSETERQFSFILIGNN